jgi:hypothetical protein
MLPRLWNCSASLQEEARLSGLFGGGGSKKKRSDDGYIGPAGQVPQGEPNSPFPAPGATPVTASAAAPIPRPNPLYDEEQVGGFGSASGAPSTSSWG